MNKKIEKESDLNESANELINGDTQEEDILIWLLSVANENEIKCKIFSKKSIIIEEGGNRFEITVKKSE